MSRRSQRDIVLIERASSSPLWWLVMGGALGAGLALLFAPESGSKTRRLLARRLGRLRSAAEEVLGGDDDEDIGTEAGAEAEDQDAEDAEDEEEAVEAPSARQELEKRLTAARARRQREQGDEDEEPVA